MANKKMLSGGGTVKNGKRTQWSKAYDKDGKEIDFRKHNKDWFDEYGEPACENKRINMKKIIKLTENDLHRLVKESVRRLLREFNPYEDSDYPTECPYCGSDDIECVGGRGVGEKWVCYNCDEEFYPYDFPEPPQGDGANGACIW